MKNPRIPAVPTNAAETVAFLIADFRSDRATLGPDNARSLMQVALQKSTPPDTFAEMLTEAVVQLADQVPPTPTTSAKGRP